MLIYRTANPSPGPRSLTALEAEIVETALDALADLGPGLTGVLRSPLDSTDRSELAETVKRLEAVLERAARKYMPYGGDHGQAEAD